MELSRNVALPPVRPLADFVGSEARFAVPDYKDPVRWNNRIVNNLLYYQTNYIAVATGIFILAGLMNPLAMLVGTMLVTVVMLLLLMNPLAMLVGTMLVTVADEPPGNAGRRDAGYRGNAVVVYLLLFTCCCCPRLMNPLAMLVGTMLVTVVMLLLMNPLAMLVGAMLVAVVMLLLLMNPLAMLVGTMLVTVVFAAFIALTENQRQLQRFKKDHPTVCVAGLLAACYFIMRTFQLLLVFVFGITLPLLVVLVHASMRMRNLKNKLSNKVESIGIKRTPMGILLEALGQEQEAGS
ncbi:ARL6IP5 [Branchiostoma lanceolatum]|uniref:PRA1 family protein n=1 Tax=Branchiostoma lanceolatum TaxID=7740 RepID=A0A8J9ZVQ4_BRALA|nr:ARL6IP5 [Branchiostoma lanceolatum]